MKYLSNIMLNENSYSAITPLMFNQGMELIWLVDWSGYFSQ